MGPIAVVDADAGQIHPKWAVTDGVDPIFVIVIGQPVFGEKGKIQAKEEAQEDKRQSAGEKDHFAATGELRRQDKGSGKAPAKEENKNAFFRFCFCFSTVSPEKEMTFCTSSSTCSRLGCSSALSRRPSSSSVTVTPKVSAKGSRRDTSGILSPVSLS